MSEVIKGRARIYLPPRPATQSGHAKSRHWVLEFEPAAPPRPEWLMGWTSGPNTQSQVRLSFPTLEAARAYAERHGIPYDLEPPRAAARFRPKSYADNFRYDRLENWTH